MATKEFTFFENKKGEGNVFHFDAYNFIAVRSTALSLNANHILPVFICRFVNDLDYIKDMKEGKEYYFALCEYGCYRNSSLEALNATVKRMNKEGDTYRANPNSGFVVKRTAKKYIYRTLTYELD